MPNAMLSTKKQNYISEFDSNAIVNPARMADLTMINEDSNLTSSKYNSLTPSEMITETLSDTSFNLKLDQSYRKEEDVNDDPEPKLARLSDTAVMDMKGIIENINRKPMYELKDTQVLTFDPSTNLHRKKPSLFLDLSSVTNVNNIGS